MSEAQPACCPACGAPVDLMKIAATSVFDRYICPHCKASLQRTGPADDQAMLAPLMLTFAVIGLSKFSPWVWVLLPLAFAARHVVLKRQLPTVTFKLAEPWSLRA